MTTGAWFVGRLVIILGFWWAYTTPGDSMDSPRDYLEFSTPPAYDAVKASASFLETVGKGVALSLPAADDVVLQEHRSRAFVTGQDGWIWILKLQADSNGTMIPVEWERLVETPLMPAGARALPGNDDILLVCVSRFGGRHHSGEEGVGLYRVDVPSKLITPVLTHLPVAEAGLEPTPDPGSDGYIDHGIVTKPGSAARLRTSVGDLTASGSRPFALCNDLDISADGRRVYISEPNTRPDASMGPGAAAEAILPSRRGHMWMLEFDAERPPQANIVERVAYNFHFLDGILIDQLPTARMGNTYDTDTSAHKPSTGSAEARESSVIITETVNFSMQRLFIDGPRAGEVETIQRGMPCFPDGIDRDPINGRIYVGCIKERSAVVTAAHLYPSVIKPLLLRLPLDLLPAPPQTGIAILSPDGTTPLLYVIHDGSIASEISVVTPGPSGSLLLPQFTFHGRETGIFMLRRDDVDAEIGRVHGTQPLS